ncbi:zf-HC2 domain-containing protein [Aquipluma nitroreducens]|nr:zf-HC2 domain-containing protein [Aquipluma nitroreducens]
MKCEEVNINLPEYIDRKLDETTSAAIRSHLESCPSCKALHSELSSFINYMDSFPAPEVPEGMKEEFEGMVASLGNQEKKKIRLVPMWTKIAAMMVFAFGTYWLGFQIGSRKGEIVQNQLTSELSTQKQQVLLASLREYTGPQKIDAVYSISTTGNVSTELIDALVNTMNTDKNANVRLAAISALSEMMGKNDRIKTELIKSLTVQENPLLQISLIQVLTEKGVKEAKHQIESISNNEKTDESVKAYAKDMMKTII